MTFKVGQLVQSRRGEILPYIGRVERVFDNWENLKNKNYFDTIDPEDESDRMSAIEKLINGDPKDKWLKMQKIPFTERQLDETWYSVLLETGGAVWTCHSKLQDATYLLN